MKLSAVCFLSFVAILGCSDGSDFSGISPSAAVVPGDVQPNGTQQWCETHPVQCGIENPDPSPSSHGLYLGSQITQSNCSLGAYAPGGDVDLDGFGDLCEQVIAEAFAPELFFSSSDSWMGRETYWAASYRPDGGEFLPEGVLLFYALGYYADGGSPTAICQGGSPPIPCLGHLGDSEWVQLIVTYNAQNHHWELKIAFYSQHTSYGDYTSWDLYYPEKDLGFPRVYVGIGKHSNYASDSECDSGGALGTDTCSGNTSERVVAGRYRNLGSSAYNRVNCVASQESFSLQQLGYEECFWTATYFTGWSGDNSGDVEGYKFKLGEF